MEHKIDQVLSDLTSLKNSLTESQALINNQLRVLDIRLSLIEQRLSNIEPWISVDNRNLKYDASRHPVSA